MAQTGGGGRLTVVTQDVDSAHEVATVPSDLSSFLSAERDRLVGLAYLFTGSGADAEDAVQAALVRLTNKDLGHVQDLPSYVRRAVVNEATSWKRSAIRRERLVVPPKPTDEVGDLIAAVDLARALGRLGTKHRAVVVLRYYLDLDDAAIAATLGCAPATVRSRLSRALRRLRADLEGES